MVESKPQAKPQAESLVVIGWIFNNSIYDKLRVIEGCEKLEDLKATPTDVEHIKKMFQCYGVKDENLYLNAEPDLKQLNATYIEIRKKSRALTGANQAHVILVYCGGHGATLDEKQIYLVNTDQPKLAMFQMQYKLRYLVHDIESKGRVFAMFDCCRIMLDKMPGLHEATIGKGVAQREAESEEEEEACNRYFHIQACGPGGIAAADAGFAELLLKSSVKYAQREPKGLVTFPTDWQNSNWGEGGIFSNGGMPYQVKFNTDIHYNDEGAKLARGTDEGWTDKFYCGRYLGVDKIPDSDGNCGPGNGPQCESCQRYQYEHFWKLQKIFDDIIEKVQRESEEEKKEQEAKKEELSSPNS